MSVKQFFEQQAERNTALQHSLRQAFDPFGLMSTWVKAQQAWMTNPDALAAVMHCYREDVQRWQHYTLGRLIGHCGPECDVFPPNPEDTRFSDPVWDEVPFWDSLKEWYLLNTRWLQDALYQTPGLGEQERSRAAFWLRQWLNAIAPNNFLLTNPVAMAKALATHGESLVAGLKNFAEDAKNGNISMTDLSAFRVGENLALTPGAVVYRNPLLEVIHYEATTPTVHKTPLVIVSPWINKFYVLDLNPQKSLVKYLTDQGFSVFITSWKNPDASMRDVSFDDYLLDGVVKIIDVAREISGADKVNLAAYCIGGTLVATYLAWANRQDPDHVPVESATLFTTLTDFARPGDIEVFIDEEGLSFIESIMARQGYLDGKELASSFRMLRPNSLIWNYWVGNYLLGETPTAFDVLYWNMDSTRMPEAMHRFYLREMYWKNKLIEPDALNIAGQPINLARIKQPLYMVSAEEDHIAPWKQTFSLVHRTGGDVLFTLSSSGHIIGIVNPPGPKCKRTYWQGVPLPGETAEEWQARQTHVPGSWWDNWAGWLRERSGEQVKPKLSSRAHPKQCAAPGKYVLE